VLRKILTALFLVGGASALYAGPVYSCGGGSACNGNLYAVWVVSQTATSYVLDVGIQVTDNYLVANGGPGSHNDFIDGLAIIPDIDTSFTSAKLTGSPAGMWSLQNGGLTSGGCSGSGAPFICAGASGMGSNLFTSNGTTYTPKTIVWQFTLQGTPPSLGDVAHIKYHYISYVGSTVGDLGSFDIAIQCVGGVCDGSVSGPASAVPEPVSSALIGSGLVGLYFIRRRFRG
jgi:hypothetical protein